MSFDIETLVDIRSMPGSTAHPQFNQSSLNKSLKKVGIKYVYMPELGGRRKARVDSTNTARHNKSFMGYADYMETITFSVGIERLEQLAGKKNTAYMCAEAVWRRCHRSLVSDYLKVRGWKVMHIMGIGKSTEHPYTSPAHIVKWRLLY